MLWITIRLIELVTDCQVLHGDIVQAQREITLESFKKNRFSVLVATDVAARGLDIENIDLVVQLKPPLDTETYIHRSGRTGRAGKHGICITMYSKYQLPRLRALEREIGVRFERAGTPQPVDLYKAAALSATQSALDILEKYPQMLNQVMTAAQQLLDDVGDPIKALAALVVVAGGFDKPMPVRSLLGARENMTTIKLSLPNNEKIKFKPFVLRVISSTLRMDEANTGKNLGTDCLYILLVVPFYRRL